MSHRFMPKTPLLIAALGLAFATASATAEPWRFGVMADTQWTTTATAINVNSVAVKQALAVNQKFIEAGVKFVVQVGDLGDNTSTAALQTRLAANAALDAAGIPFYAVRGNHDNSSAQIAFYKANYVPASNASRTVNVMADGETHSILTNGVKLIMLGYNNTGSLTNQPNATAWMAGELATGDHDHAFVISHKNLLGQNHKDNFFGSSNDANATTLQNPYFAAVGAADVRYHFSGHDHMHHRARVTSPDGLNSIQQFIFQSNSSKWYTPASPFSARETAFRQERSKIGHYLFTVDGPRVTGQYFATTPVGSDIADNPVWTLQETFGYSKNGSSKIVASGASYAMTHSIAAGSSFGEDGYVGTTMAIIDGVNSNTAKTYDGRLLSKDVNTGWASQASTQNSQIASDVLTLWGMQNALASEQSDTYTLSLDYKTNGGAFAIVGKGEDGNWSKAAERNFGGSGKFVIGPWKAGYALGTYGVNPATKTAWAVVNRGGEFAVSRSLDGDLNGDGVIDRNDVLLITQNLNQPAAVLPAADVDNDGRITALDARRLTTICSNANCQ